MVESHEALERYVNRSEDATGAANAALADLRSAVADIAERMGGHDSLDVLENIALTNLIADPETYAETEHEGSFAVVELVALVAGSKSVVGSDSAPGGYDVRSQPNIDGVQTAGRAALQAGEMWQMFESVQSENGIASLGLQLSVREANVRSSSYPHMLKETLVELFDDAQIQGDVESATGVTASDIFVVFDGLSHLRQQGWGPRFEALRKLSDSIGEWQQERSLDEVKALTLEALQQVWGNPSQAAEIDFSTVAKATGLPIGTVEKVIKLFASDVSGDEANDLVERFFSGDNPFRTRPILRHPSGRYVVVHEALLFPSVRERIEDELKDAKLADRYFKRRASVTESAGLRHLQVIFPSASITQSFEYFVPNPDNPLETAPAAYTKLVEGDGLVVVDDVAIIVEAKAGALSARARSGSLGRLRGDLRSLISDAAQQASRVRDRILADGFLRLRDGSLLDLSHVREVYTVALTLEDLSGIATVTDELVDAGLLPKDFLPLVVSLHDLRIISEIVDNPAEFLLYLRRRTLPELTRRFLAVDELDFFLHMFNTGLYVEPDPDVLAKELPLLPVTNAQRRRFKNQHPEFLTSRTVPLDDWYRYLGGERSTPAPKPAMKHMSDRLRQMVDSITALGLPGWLSATTTLLAGDAEMRTKVADYGPSLAQVTRGDGKPHTMTVIAGDRSQSLIVLAWISEPAGLDANQRAIFDTHHAAYLAAKKHQVQATRAVLIVYSSEGEYLRHIFDGRIAGPDPALDAEINRFGLRTPSEMNADQATKRFRQLKAGRRPR